MILNFHFNTLKSMWFSYISFVEMLFYRILHRMFLIKKVKKNQHSLSIIRRKNHLTPEWSLIEFLN